MRRKILLIVISVASVLVLAAGCTSSTGSATIKPSSQEILRKSTIGTDWQMYQLRLIIPGGSGMPILLKLSPGDKVDGYFYLEKGTNVGFAINADSEMYRSVANSSGVVTSDRFSFNATKEMGSTYSLQFNSVGNASTEQQVVFLEVIYPVKGGIFVPLETK